MPQRAVVKLKEDIEWEVSGTWPGTSWSGPPWYPGNPLGIGPRPAHPPRGLVGNFVVKGGGIH